MPLLFALPVHDLDVILDNPKLGGAIVSATVSSLDGQPVFERNSGLHMMPASNQKLLSNAYALWKLGAAYRPVTRFWKRGRNVFVDSPGDPLLEFGDVVAMRRRLALPSNAVVNLRQRYWPGIPPGWEFDDLPNKYAAPITAFNVNQASFELWSIGGRLAGRPSLFGVRPVQVAGSGSPSVSYDPILRKVTVTGRLPTAPTLLDTLAQSEPDRQAARLLGPGYRAVTDVPGVTPDGTITGKTVANLVRECLPPSDNQIAEHLLLMAATKGQMPVKDPYPLAQKSLETFMASIVGVAPDDTHVSDGSGLSRHNFVTTRGVARLLRWANAQPTAPVWRSALVQPGQGTLKTRLAGVQFAGKTGTLDMVVALSGYVRHKSGQELVVSIIINQFGGSAQDAREIADQFVSEVAHVELGAEAR